MGINYVHADSPRVQTYTEVLAPTKTQPHRSLDWTPCDPAAGCPCSGTLVLKTSKRYQTYTVTETYPGRGFSGRAFRLQKPDGTVYDVLLGFEPQCDCAAGTYHGTCIHRDALAAVVQMGWLPDPACHPGDVGATAVDDQGPPTEEIDPAELTMWRAECDQQEAW